MRQGPRAIAADRSPLSLRQSLGTNNINTFVPFLPDKEQMCSRLPRSRIDPWLRSSGFPAFPLSILKWERRQKSHNQMNSKTSGTLQKVGSDAFLESGGNTHKGPVLTATFSCTRRALTHRSKSSLPGMYKVTLGKPFGPVAAKRSGHDQGVHRARRNKTEKHLLRVSDPRHWCGGTKRQGNRQRIAVFRPVSRITCCMQTFQLARQHSWD